MSKHRLKPIHFTDPAAVSAVVDPNANAELLVSHLRKVPRTLTEARTFARDLIGRSKNRNELVYDAIMKDPESYGLVIVKTGIGVQTLIGSVEGVGAAISAIHVKEA